MTELQSFLTAGVFAFIIAFVRIGIVIMMMPGIGNTFVPPQTRLYFALSFAFVFFPIIQAKMPSPVPTGLPMVLLIGTEFLIGFFIGSVARILMSAMDVAGIVISTQASLSNAQLFNPQFASQGSVVGTFLTLVAVLLLFSTNLYHMLILGIVQSYEVFPVGQIPDAGGMSRMITDAIAGAFAVGIQITAPFIIVILLLYIGMAVLSKLMPQVQIFMIAMPVQILLSLVLLAITGSVLMMVWLEYYQRGLGYFLASGE